MTESLAHILGGFETADQVAERFAAAGVKATPGDPCDCAVARYVRLYFGTAQVFNDNDGTDFVVYADDEVFYVDEEDPVGEFIRAFDDGRYPQLVSVEAASA